MDEGRPAIAEEIVVMRDAMLAEETRRPCPHLPCVHRQVGGHHPPDEEAGVAPHLRDLPSHFTLTEDEISHRGALARINPPLRTRFRTSRASSRAWKDGTIDAIATDHAPTRRGEGPSPGQGPQRHDRAGDLWPLP